MPAAQSIADELRSLDSRTASDAKLTSDELDQWLAGVPEWIVDEQEIVRIFSFEDFGATMKFVNAVAAVAEKENHHPDMQVSYSRCVVKFSTHDAGGLTIKDLICAAKVDAINS